MKSIDRSFRASAFIGYALLAFALAGFVQYLFYFHPVAFTTIIAEDSWGENATAVCFFLAAVLLFGLSFFETTRLRKAASIVIGGAILMIAAEEISWGQRILGLGTPYPLQEHNLQGELNLHNLAVVSSLKWGLHFIASLLIAGYLVFSASILLFIPRLGDRLAQYGVPLIPIQLIPMFLLAPYFFRIYPVAKSDEVGELFLGLAVLVWAVDRFLTAMPSDRNLPASRLLTLPITLGIVALLTVALTSVSSPSLTSRLNMMASRDYPKFGMYAQADVLFSYIYAHPRRIKRGTKMNNVKVLLESGRQGEAKQMLVTMATDLESNVATENLDSWHYRELGVVYSLLSNTERAEANFDIAIKIDQERLSLSKNEGQKSAAVFSMSETLVARGDSKSAIELIKTAFASTDSPRLRYRYSLRLEKLDATQQEDGQ